MIDISYEIFKNLDDLLIKCNVFALIPQRYIREHIFISGHSSEP